MAGPGGVGYFARRRMEKQREKEAKLEREKALAMERQRTAREFGAPVWREEISRGRAFDLPGLQNMAMVSQREGRAKKQEIRAEAQEGRTVDRFGREKKEWALGYEKLQDTTDILRIKRAIIAGQDPDLVKLTREKGGRSRAALIAQASQITWAEANKRYEAAKRAHPALGKKQRRELVRRGDTTARKASGPTLDPREQYTEYPLSGGGRGGRGGDGGGGDDAAFTLRTVAGKGKANPSVLRQIIKPDVQERVRNLYRVEQLGNALRRVRGAKRPDPAREAELRKEIKAWASTLWPDVDNPGDAPIKTGITASIERRKILKAAAERERPGTLGWGERGDGQPPATTMNTRRAAALLGIRLGVPGMDFTRGVTASYAKHILTQEAIKRAAAQGLDMTKLSKTGRYSAATEAAIKDEWAKLNNSYQVMLGRIESKGSR